ncbi:unnamed protein product, partial [Coregonus sp. 'balchen']
RTCDRCDYGYKLLNSSHLDGCVGCDCDPVGSLSPFCEPEGGQCECRVGVGGQRCDSCERGLYGLHQEGSCILCLCSLDGTVPGTVCDPETGHLERRNSLGCLACACDVRGTLERGVCDPVNGHCPCREGVEGALCTRCSLHYYNTTSDLYDDITPHPYYNMIFDPQGCVPCVCDPTGTVEGTMCDADTGQCVCVPTRHGRDCGICRPGDVCVECDCHPVGSSGQVCDGRMGQCLCVDPSVGGRRCDQCQELHYGFNPGLGSPIHTNPDLSPIHTNPDLSPIHTNPDLSPIHTNPRPQPHTHQPLTSAPYTPTPGLSPIHTNPRPQPHTHQPQASAPYTPTLTSAPYTPTPGLSPIHS